MRCFNVDDSNPDFFGYPAKKSTPKHQVALFRESARELVLQKSKT